MSKTDSLLRSQVSRSPAYGRIGFRLDVRSDIGGILPGSMPPTSTNINEEGANIQSLKIVSDGQYDHEGLYRVMVEEPSKYPGCSGCRNFRDVESDVKAQIAANNKGSSLLRALVEEYDLKTVHEYMEHIRK